MSFLNGFLDNVVSGALNPKGTLGDYAHGSRLYVDDSHRLSPKVKFLSHEKFLLYYIILQVKKYFYIV